MIGSAPCKWHHMGIFSMDLVPMPGTSFLTDACPSLQLLTSAKVKNLYFGLTKGLLQLTNVELLYLQNVPILMAV
jgi:hypothetical protein